MQSYTNDNKFYFKVVAKLGGKFYSIYDGKTEFNIGQTHYQKAEENHNGGFYVYATLDEAIFADIPQHKGGLFFAPRTIIKAICWGDKIEYPNGKIAFSYICPIENLGMPRGYKVTKAGQKEALKQYQFKQTMNNIIKKKKPTQYKQYNSNQQGQQED